MQRRGALNTTCIDIEVDPLPMAKGTMAHFLFAGSSNQSDTDRRLEQWGVHPVKIRVRAGVGCLTVHSD